MPSKHDPADSLHDIIDNAERVARYLAGMDQAAFERSETCRDAVERCIERVCEATYRLRDRAEELMPGQPWAEIRGMGNRLRHAYDRLDVDIIWNTACVRLPTLAAAARLALARLEADTGGAEPGGGADRPPPDDQGSASR